MEEGVDDYVGRLRGVQVAHPPGRSVIGRAAQALPADVDRAVAAAGAAFE